MTDFEKALKQVEDLTIENKKLKDRIKLYEDIMDRDIMEDYDDIDDYFGPMEIDLD